MKWSNFKGSNSSLIVALGSKRLVNYLCINYELPLYTKEQLYYYFMDQCMCFPITDAINVGWSEKNAICACKLILYA